MTANSALTSPEALRTPLGRVIEAISLSAEARRARQEATQSAISIPSPPLQEGPTGSVSDRGRRQTVFGSPVIFAGMDGTCSICHEEFQHGQRVCRLSCRHIFHSTCWGVEQSGIRTSSQTPRTSCPNCREAGTLIAVWHYIDESRVAQKVEGWRVPNLLEAGASMHCTHTPPAEMQTPAQTLRSVTTTCLAGDTQLVPESPASNSFGSLYSNMHQADVSSRGESRSTEPSAPTFHIQTRPGSLTGDPPCLWTPAQWETCAETNGPKKLLLPRPVMDTCPPTRSEPAHARSVVWATARSRAAMTAASR